MRTLSHQREASEMEYSAAEKYRGMLRAYDALKRVSTDNGNAISNRDANDAAETFFNQCYHFKDWLKKERPADAMSIETFISTNDALALAADFCNSFKHAGLDRAPRSGKDIQRINTHVKMDLTPRGFVTSSRLELTISGKSYDAFTLATDCLKAWNIYLQKNGIAFWEP
jgi:hypothetical protein